MAFKSLAMHCTLIDQSVGLKIRIMTEGWSEMKSYYAWDVYWNTYALNNRGINLNLYWDIVTIFVLTTKSLPSSSKF